MLLLLIYIFILPGFLHKGYSERTKDKMYERITATSACYRRLNATHQVGCSSKRGGSTGIVHFCETLEDLDLVLSNGTAAPYIPVLPVKYFDMITLQKLISSGKVSGLLLHANNNTEPLTHFTHDYQCPNMLSNYNDTCNTEPTWNPFGTGLLFADIPFPIFYAENQVEVLKIKKCFNEFNNYSYESQADRSLCSLELKSFMYATTDTLTCRRRSNIISNLNPIKFCDPLGDSNIWASLYPLVTEFNNETKPLKGFKYIIIAARMDSTSMFEKTAGANSPVTGMVALLSIAKFLKETLTSDDIINSGQNILFMLFNGETYDYIGSQRMLYDMLNGNFPIDVNNDILPIIQPEDIRLFVELSQLGNSKKSVYAHYLQGSDAIEQFFKSMQANNHSLEFKNLPKSVPPASLHTFLKYNKDFPGLIISDHETSYANHFYHSIYDDASNIGFNYYNVSSQHDIDAVPLDSIQYFIANLSVAVGAAVYEKIKEKSFDVSYDVKKLVPLVNELLLCYIETPQCKLQNATRLEGRLPKSPFDLYVGVDHVNNYATTLTALTLGWLTADVENSTGPCINKSRSYAYKFYNMSKSLDELNVIICFKITMNTTDAVSPAFIIPDYNWTSGVYSSWTESTWNELNVRMFLKPSSAHERMTIILGIFTLVMSFFIVYFISSRSHILFTSPLPTEAPTDC